MIYMWVKKFIARLINMKILPLWGEKWELYGKGGVRRAFPPVEGRSDK
jgi:hypothetical protein